MDAVCNSKASNNRIQLTAPAGFVRTGEDQMEVWRCGAGEGFEEKIATFFGMNAPEKEQKGKIGERGEGVGEGVAEGGGVTFWAGSSIRNHNAAEIPEWKADGSYFSLLFAGEANGLCTVQIFSFGQRPVGEFF